jgi:hypothetical protein
VPTERRRVDPGVSRRARHLQTRTREPALGLVCPGGGNQNTYARELICSTHNVLLSVPAPSTSPPVNYLQCGGYSGPRSSSLKLGTMAFRVGWPESGTPARKLDSAMVPGAMCDTQETHAKRGYLSCLGA